MLRAECGAVMVGSGTQQADDPQLAQPRPVRSIVQRSLAWLLANRRLTVRHERRADILTAFLHLASALICARRLKPL